MKIGYTSGVFDLFHIGHLNLLERAKLNCDKLIVGVCSDKLAFDLKGKKPVICLEDRLRIVRALKCVDEVCIKPIDDEFFMAQTVNADIIFKGSDWKGTKKWIELEKRFDKIGVRTKFFLYTKKISSSKLRGLL
jgi:glycerol-3-phosphate cytidylyltransferase